MEDRQERPRLILVSASPRRRELIASLTAHFEVAHSTVEEEGDTLFDQVTPLPPLPLPAPYAVPLDSDPRLWARRKAVDYAERKPQTPATSLLVAADTVVVTRGELLGKPRDADDAMRMLTLLSGDSHWVVTACGVYKMSSGEPQELTLTAAATEVVMRDASDEERAAYIATGEPFDKAGAYALQGLGGALVREVMGCVTNVIGLPLCVLRRQLSEAGVPLMDRPPGGYCGSCKV